MIGFVAKNEFSLSEHLLVDNDANRIEIDISYLSINNFKHKVFKGKRMLGINGCVRHSLNKIPVANTNFGLCLSKSTSRINYD